MTTITITIKSRYSDRNTTVRAKIRPACGGTHEIAEISKRQLADAAKRCCYAGTDSPRVIGVDGWGDWEPTESGGMSMIRRVRAA
jgi:hypothetical protein